MKKLVSPLFRLLAVSLLLPHTFFAVDPAKATEDIVADSFVEQSPFTMGAEKEPSTTTNQDTRTEDISDETSTSDSDTEENESEVSSDENKDGAASENPLESTNKAIEKTKAPTKNVLSEELSETTTPMVTAPEAPSDKGSTMVEFNYTNEDIVNIINSLAAKKGVNVIIPLGAQALANKVTLSLPNRITLDEAWSFLQTFLDISGYGLIPRAGMYYVTKKNGAIAKEALPLYIVKPEDLPNTDQRIRYIYYLSNIKVSDAPDSELSLLLKDILPSDAGFKMDPASNGIIISARSLEIKALMAIITKLDKVGFLEKFDILHLRFTSAKDVAAMFNDSLLKGDTDPNRYHLDTKKTSDTTYFSKFTRLIPDERTNSLIILGRFQAIERIKEFIRQYVDIKIDEGKSPIHVYSLQYLQAEVIAPILEKIIQSESGATTGQSQVAGAAAGGVQRQFGEVKIKADTPTQQPAQPGKEGAAPVPSYFGGNKLIIACSSDDWKQIERLIQDLDQPRSQVLIEVFIADLTLDDLHELGTSIRNPGKVPLPGSLNFQTTNLGNKAFITEGTTPNATIKADLLKTALPANNPVTFAGTEPDGAMILSFNDSDGRVWGVGEALKKFGAQKVLSAPHVIATNNQMATIVRSEQRLLPGAGNNNSVSSIVNYEWANADLSVYITPRINEGDDVNMQIKISINEFVPSTIEDDPTPTRRTREVTANATVTNNNILVLGGLIRVGDLSNSNETPFFSKIPLLGWFFKWRSKDVAKTNLTIFIKPIVINPRLRAGVQEHTQEFLNYVDNYTGKNSTFSSLKDPVTKIFFSGDNNTSQMVDNFLRFQREEIAKSQEPSVQHVDLEDGSTIIEKKKAIKAELDITKPDSKPAVPNTTEPDVQRTTNSVDRAEQMKNLLKNGAITPVAKKKSASASTAKPEEKTTNS